MDHLDLIIGGVVAGLFFMLGFYLSTVRAEKRHFRLRERQREEALASQRTSGRAEEDATVMSRLRGELAAQSDAVKQKDADIEKMSCQLTRLMEDYRKLEEQMRGTSGGQDELESLGAALAAKGEEIVARDRELVQLRDEVISLRERSLKADEALEAFGRFETEIRAQKDVSQEIERRFGEIKIKMRVLTEKSKEGADLIARYAAGKEFGDLRASVDEAAQAHQDEEPEGGGSDHPPGIGSGRDQAADGSREVTSNKLCKLLQGIFLPNSV